MMRPPKEVARWFSTDRVADRWDGLYDDRPAHVEEDNFQLRRDYAIDLVETRVPRDGRILDLGCGAGPVLAELLLRDRKAVGVDYAPDMLTFARARLARHGFERPVLLRADAAALPFPDRSFACVLALGVISYQDDYSFVLREIRRILVPGGLSLITFRNVFNPLASDPLKAARALGRYLVRRERPRQAGLGRFLDPDAVQRDIEAADLTCERFEGIGIGPFGVGGLPVFRDRTSIRISRALGGALSRLPSDRTLRLSADVAMFVCHRS
jgi:ubiquinone/menaquinone biosynthesis C-methylase UbiE